MRRAAIAVLSMVFLGLGADTAMADPPVKFDTFFSSVNLCNGDTVELAGKFSVQQNFKPNGDVVFHQIAHGQGVGQPSGAEYVLNLNDHIAFRPGETEVRVNSRLTSKGSEPNMIIVIVERNGEFSFTTDCRG
jgi:hypothetical protein